MDYQNFDALPNKHKTSETSAFENYRSYKSHTLIISIRLPSLLIIAVVVKVKSQLNAY